MFSIINPSLKGINAFKQSSRPVKGPENYTYEQDNSEESEKRSHTLLVYTFCGYRFDYFRPENGFSENGYGIANNEQYPEPDHLIPITFRILPRFSEEIN